MENRSIAESLEPTFENVTRKFITETMYDILFNEEFPNFKFEFREDEAVAFIEKVLNEYTKEYNFYEEKAQKILENIKKKSDGNQIQPIMTVNNYKEFFEQLRQYYKQDIEL